MCTPSHPTVTIYNWGSREYTLHGHAFLMGLGSYICCNHEDNAHTAKLILPQQQKKKKKKKKKKERKRDSELTA